jgi:hypothetical protein
MRTLFLCATLTSLLGGCALRGLGNEDGVAAPPDGVDTEIQSGPASASALPAACRPPTPKDIESLYDATERSVHELVTCGGIQMQVALSMKVMIFASNEELVSPSARRDIQSAVEAVGMTVDNPFTATEDGTWTMATGGADGSRFDLAFFDPTTGDVITVDPFSLDSYLRGVTARSSRTWEEMKRNPTARTTFTYDWTELGPLGHMLADGGPVPNPIVLQMSLLELGGAALGFTEVDYGPFESVQNLEVESKIHMVDDVDLASVAYEVTGRKTTVERLVDLGSLSFDVESLVSTDGVVTFSGDAEGLAFVGRGSLAGEIRYSVSGPGADLLVTSDFGGGNAYPVPRWECR